MDKQALIDLRDKVRSMTGADWENFWGICCAVMLFVVAASIPLAQILSALIEGE